MKLNHLFIIVSFFVVRSVHSQNVDRLKHQVMTRDLIQKAQDVQDPELKGLLALHAIYFAEKFEFSDELWGPLNQLAYNASIQINREQFYTISEKSLIKAQYQADSLFNQFLGHFPIARRKNMDKSVAVRSVQTSADPNVLYSAGGDGKLLKWNIEERSTSTLLSNLKINQLKDLSDDETLLAFSTSDNTIKILSLNGQTIEIQKHNGPIIDLKFLNGSHDFITIGVDKQIILHSNEKPLVLANIEFAPTSLAISQDNGTVFVASRRPGNLIELDLESKNLTELIKDESIGIETLTVSPTGKYLAIGGSYKLTALGYLRLYDLENNRLLTKRFDGFLAPITDIEFSSDERFLAAGSLDNTVRIWQSPMQPSSTLPCVLRDHEDWVFDVSIDIEDSKVYTASKEGKIRVFQLSPDEYQNFLIKNLSRELTLEEWQLYIGNTSDFPFISLKEVHKNAHQDL